MFSFFILLRLINYFGPLWSTCDWVRVRLSEFHCSYSILLFISSGTGLSINPTWAHDIQVHKSPWYRFWILVWTQKSFCLWKNVVTQYIYSLLHLYSIKSEINLTISYIDSILFRTLVITCFFVIGFSWSLLPSLAFLLMTLVAVSH